MKKNMKKILIRLESYEKSWLWWMETRIKEFLDIKNLDHSFFILSNRNLNNFFNKKIILSNYNNFFWILKDILTFRNFNIIESNWHRDNLISILNYILFLPIYKYKKIKLFIVIHWILWIKQNKWVQKIIYNIIFFIWIIFSNKIICVSEETRIFLKDNFIWKNIIEKKSIIVPNYININNNFLKEKIIKIHKALIVSRIDNNKKKWIIDAINFCKKYNIKLEIYWWWDEKIKLEKKYKDIKFYWEVNNSSIIYNNYDLIIWMWRSLLEWLSKNLIWILIWYDKLICNLSKRNLEKIEMSNFSWRWIKKIDKKKIYENLNKNIENKDYIKICNLIKNKYWLENFKDYWE